MSLVFTLGYWVYGAVYFDSTEYFKGPIDVFFQFGLPLLVVIAFWFYKSATPGKQLLGLKIINSADFGEPSKTQFLKRYLGYYISLVPLFLVFFWAAFDSRKRAFHDVLSTTLVIYVSSDNAA